MSKTEERELMENVVRKMLEKGESDYYDEMIDFLTSEHVDLTAGSIIMKTLADMPGLLFPDRASYISNSEFLFTILKLFIIWPIGLKKLDLKEFLESDIVERTNDHHLIAAVRLTRRIQDKPAGLENFPSICEVRAAFPIMALLASAITQKTIKMLDLGHSLPVMYSEHLPWVMMLACKNETVVEEITKSAGNYPRFHYFRGLSNNSILDFLITKARFHAVIEEEIFSRVVGTFGSTVLHSFNTRLNTMYEISSKITLMGLSMASNHRPYKQEIAFLFYFLFMKARQVKFQADEVGFMILPLSANSMIPEPIPFMEDFSDAVKRVLDAALSDNR